MPLDAAVSAYFSTVDEIPLHFHLHLVHSSEILGYKHPVPSIRNFWHQLYLQFVKGFHMNPETEAEMDKRLGDQFDDWRAREANPGV